MVKKIPGKRGEKSMAKKTACLLIIIRDPYSAE